MNEDSVTFGLSLLLPVLIVGMLLIGWYPADSETPIFTAWPEPTELVVDNPCGYPMPYSRGACWSDTGPASS